jgi:hypothetical protein
MIMCSCARWLPATFRKAGVTDVRAGTRFLRHNAASRLLPFSARAREALTNLYMSFDRQRHPGGSAEPDHLRQRLGLLGVIPDRVEQQVGGT